MTGPAYKFHAYTGRDLPELLVRTPFDQEQRLAVQAVAQVMPFRVNSYVLDELIDWSAVPDDPLFRLTFPQPDMLPAADIAPLVDMLRKGQSGTATASLATAIRRRLNPHPAGQVDLNTPRCNGVALNGLQHKYAETVLFFPRHGQLCHTYCTYCFRWPQFVGDPALKIAGEVDALVDYLLVHPEVTDVLITGGDPMVMSTARLARYIIPLLDPRLSHLSSIRFGSKALGYWPHRFTSAPDADDLLRLFDRMRAAGREPAFMAHVSHQRELATEAAVAAVRRITSAGVVVRTQAPLIRQVNDDAGAWADMWRSTVRLGAVPYYMFVARDTGPRGYFEVSLARAWEIYRDACARVTGLARTARGPSMSATPGKITIDGIADLAGERVFVLRYLQARDPSLVNRPFFAKYDDTAAWLSDLVPLRPADQLFFDAAATGAELPIEEEK